MSRAQSDTYVVGSTIMTIGLSQVIKYTPPSNQIMANLKYLSGGSIEIVAPQLSGASTGTSFTGKGYLLGTTESFSIYGPAVFYLAATGATAILGVGIQYTSGATVI